MARPLGRRTPPDFSHVEKYPYAALKPATITKVNKFLSLPYWHWTHDQGFEGSCVGHGSAFERAVCNTAQMKLIQLMGWNRRYDPINLWNEAKKVDQWPDTNPGDDNGTSVSAAYDVLRKKGPRRIVGSGIHIDSYTGQPVVTDFRYPTNDPAEGIAANRWATSVDELRAAIAAGKPITIGVNWYDNFDEPEYDGYWYWIGKGSLGSIRGGHSLCIYGASDSKQAFRLKNSWGKSYPLVWLPYTTMQRLLNEDGEATLVTDR